jgi:hypothetical protein
MTDSSGDVRISSEEEAPLDNILNFRDVGKTINKFLGERWVLIIYVTPIMLTSRRRVAEGRIYRSARPGK